MEVAIPSAVLLLVSISVVIGCVTRKRPEKKDEEMDADENPVSGSINLQKHMRDNTAQMRPWIIMTTMGNK